MKAYLVLCAGIPMAAHLLPAATDGRLVAGLVGVVVVAMVSLDLVRERHVHQEVLLLLHGVEAGSPLTDATAPLDVLTARADAVVGRRFRGTEFRCGTCGSRGAAAPDRAT